MKKRRVFLSFPEVGGSGTELLKTQKVIEGVNIRFSCETTSTYGIVSSGTIDVYNLNRHDTEFLTTSTSFWLNRQRLVQLYAGYDDDIRMIMSGQILEAPPSGYPDMSLHIRLYGNTKWTSEVINVQKSELKIVDLIDYVGRVTGYAVNMPDWLRRQNMWLNKRLDNYSYTGTPMDLLDKIQNMVGGYNPNEDSFVIGVQNDEIVVGSPSKDATNNVLLVSKETGMIGLPMPTYNGIDVKMLLNPDIKVNDVIKLESDRVGMCNGYYYVIKIRHEGEVRGNQFYTTLTCARNPTYLGKEATGNEGTANGQNEVEL